jgi:hypothetical protein
MERMRGIRKAGRAARRWSRNPRPPPFRGRWAMREARAGGVAEVLVMRWRRRVVVECRASVRGDCQESRVGGEVVSVWRRTSAASKWVMEGRVQNLKSVAMDWGSWMRLQRRLVAWAKVEAAVAR